MSVLVFMLLSPTSKIWMFLKVHVKLVIFSWRSHLINVLSSLSNTQIFLSSAATFPNVICIISISLLFAWSIYYIYSFTQNSLLKSNCGLIKTHARIQIIILKKGLLEVLIVALIDYMTFVSVIKYLFKIYLKQEH